MFVPPATAVAIAAAMLFDGEHGPRGVIGIKGEKLLTSPKPVEYLAGRNEPCPCGSGKKYKKCCRPR